VRVCSGGCSAELMCVPRAFHIFIVTQPLEKEIYAVKCMIVCVARVCLLSYIMLTGCAYLIVEVYEQCPVIDLIML